MKKIYQKFFSIFFVLLFSASCVPASAVDVNSVAQNHIKQFCYIVYDKEGECKKKRVSHLMETLDIPGAESNWTMVNQLNCLIKTILLLQYPQMCAMILL